MLYDLRIFVNTFFIFLFKFYSLGIYNLLKGGVVLTERLKNLRKNILNLTQTEFSNSINLKQNSYSKIENGSVSLTERNIKTICEKFNVNEEWLRNGVEPIFINDYTNMNNRIKIIRGKLNLSQKEFALKLGITQAALSKIELGGSTLTERNIKTICEIFNVNEEWLRNGTEPIFIEKDNDLISLIKKELTLSPLAKKIIISYLKLNKDDRAIFENFFENLITEILNDDTINLDNKPQLKLISFGGDNETKELNQEQANLNINNIDIENNDL